MKFARSIRYYVLRLFRLRSGAHKIALGFVMGFYPCWFPTFGVGPALSVLIARLVKANVVAAIVAAGLGSFLWPVLFYMNYVAGRLLFGLSDWLFTEKPVHLEDVDYTEPIGQVNSWSEMGTEFVVGSVFNSIVLSAVGYFVLLIIFSRYRERLLKKIRRHSFGSKKKRR